MRGKGSIKLILAFFFLFMPFLAHGANSSVSVTVDTPDCSDTIDNDSDSLVDYPADPGCSSSSDTDETDVTYECGDGIDNDTDGQIDYPADSGCDSATDNQERSGGGGGGTPSTGEVIISGITWPRATVRVLQDGSRVADVTANATGNFSISLSGVRAGTYSYSIVAEETGIQSRAETISVYLSPGAVTTISDVKLGPIFTLSRLTVRAGESIVGYGKSIPNQSGTILITGGGFQREYAVVSSAEGVVTHTFSANFPLGSYTVVLSMGGILSREFTLTIGTQTLPIPPLAFCPIKADLNADCRVNIFDFSIAAFWWQKNLFGPFLTREQSQLSGDGKVDIRDFSIMAYHWTG